MGWLVRLGGDEWSLQGLSEALQTGPRVWKDDDGSYYLSSPALSACLDDTGAWREAELTIARVNDAAAALEPGNRPVVTQAVVHVGDDGNRRAFAPASVGLDAAVARARFSATVVHADGTVETPCPSRLEQLYLKLGKEGVQSDLAKALKAWRSGTRDWRLLYHVYEIIKHDVSRGTNDYKALQAVTPRGMAWPELDEELDRFRKSANDPDHAGSEARHGRPEPKPTQNPISKGEAEDLVRRLLETWINTKI
jgi:hypothetical protein